jgi:lipoprotein-anchoring transpeptidase ErfK/SrfK
LEEGKNKGENIDTYQRYIYIHGTNEEGMLGKKSSHGCIRMGNSDIIDLCSKEICNIFVYISK